MNKIGTKLRGMDGGRVAFYCPGCQRMHQVSVMGGPPVWEWNWDGDAPTFTPSIFVNPPGPTHTEHAPSCHSFVRGGMIEFLPDSTHPLAGQTVPLQPAPWWSP